jgi:hypothetical protein
MKEPNPLAVLPTKKPPEISPAFAACLLRVRRMGRETGISATKL